MLERVWIETWPGISDSDEHEVSFGQGGGDEQVSCPVRHSGHSLDCVDNEVETNLL